METDGDAVVADDAVVPVEHEIQGEAADPVAAVEQVTLPASAEDKQQGTVSARGYVCFLMCILDTKGFSSLSLL